MKYTALVPVTVNPGTMVRLTEAQRTRCKGLVQPAAKDGWHETVAAFQFKRGEQFELDVELPKGMADAVEPDAKAAPAKAAKAARANEA